MNPAGRACILGVRTCASPVPSTGAAADLTLWFVLGAVLLVAGIAVLLVATLRRGSP